MSKSSTVTVRETPVSAVATAESGGLTIHGETFVIETDERIELVDLTERIMEFVRQLRVREGVVSLWSMHTTCAVFINEFQTALLTDIKRFLEQMVARDDEWRHNDPEHSDCDRMNADSHLRALLLGPQPDAADQRRRSRPRPVAAHPDGRTRRTARAHAARAGHGYRVATLVRVTRVAVVPGGVETRRSDAALCLGSRKSPQPDIHARPPRCRIGSPTSPTSSTPASA